MELTDRFTVQATLSTAWDFFWDLPRLAKCLPGCERIEAVDDSHFKARVAQRVGPFAVTMDLDLAVQELVPEKRVVVVGGGKDRLGNTLKLNALTMDLAALDDATTEVAYVIDFALYGQLASLGSSTIKRKAEELRVEFTRRLVAELEA